MLLSTWFATHCPHATHHVCICYSPHGSYCILPMMDIMPPYVSLHTVHQRLSTCCTSCLHMLPSTRFTCHCPHVLNHVCICYCPHGLQRIVHMLLIMSAYAALHMVHMNVPHGLHTLSTSFPASLLMLFSTWFCCMLHRLHIMSAYATLHMVCIAFSLCWTSCLHMRLSTRFLMDCPHAVHHVCICCPPHGSHVIVHMLLIMSAYAIVHMVDMHVSTCRKPYITNKA